MATAPQPADGVANTGRVIDRVHHVIVHASGYVRRIWGDVRPLAAPTADNLVAALVAGVGAAVLFPPAARGPDAAARAAPAVLTPLIPDVPLLVEVRQRVRLASVETRIRGWLATHVARWPDDTVVLWTMPTPHRGKEPWPTRDQLVRLYDDAHRAPEDARLPQREEP